MNLYYFLNLDIEKPDYIIIDIKIDPSEME